MISPKGIASITVFLALCLVTVCLTTVLSRADEPDSDRESATKVKSEDTAPPPKTEQTPAGKEVAASPSKKATLSGYGVDTADSGVPVDSQSNRLKRMHSIIEMHLEKSDQKEFEETEKLYKSGKAREAFYKSFCDQLEITC